MREPTIFWWPGRIEPGMVTDLGSTLDLLPTFCALAGAGTAPDRVLDGVDLSPVLNGPTGDMVSPYPRVRVALGFDMIAPEASPRDSLPWVNRPRTVSSNFLIFDEGSVPDTISGFPSLNFVIIT